MSKSLIAALLMLAAAPAFNPAWAQTAPHSTPPDGFIFKPAAEIDRLVSRPEAGQVYGATFMNDHENYYIEFVKRLDHGNSAELHPHWVDQVTILAGEGTLTFGGTISNPVMGAGGEVRGTGQVGATTQALHPGDFVLIPAGAAHRFDAAPGKTITYVVAKARS